MQSAIDRYMAGWNEHDPASVVAALTAGGTYEDPTTAGPISGDALAATVAGLITGFPDVHFELVDLAVTGDTSAVIRWRMTGTNTGPMPLGPATGGSVDLPGTDFFTYDSAVDKLSSVQGYFDMATTFRQLGLQVHLTPADMEPILKFGTGSRVETGRAGAPGAFTVTWIEIEDDLFPMLAEVTKGVVLEFMAHPGYLGSCFLGVGKRHYTLSAWDSPDSARAATADAPHRGAVKLAYEGGFGHDARGITSIWTPETLNGVFSAAEHRTLPLDTLEGQWL